MDKYEKDEKAKQLVDQYQGSTYNLAREIVELQLKLKENRPN